MQSVKLILVLICFGLALIVAAVVPTDASATAGSSVAGAWVMGLLGAASLIAGLVLLRRGYRAARQAQGGKPLTTSAKLLLAFSAVAALAAIAFVAFQIHDSPDRPATERSGVKTKADYERQEQQEIRRRQGSDRPAPAPGPVMPSDTRR